MQVIFHVIVITHFSDGAGHATEQGGSLTSSICVCVCVWVKTNAFCLDDTSHLLFTFLNSFDFTRLFYYSCSLLIFPTTLYTKLANLCN